jgi:hypothetical protein
MTHPVELAILRLCPYRTGTVGLAQVSVRQTVRGMPLRPSPRFSSYSWSLILSSHA